MLGKRDAQSIEGPAEETKKDVHLRVKTQSTVAGGGSSVTG